MTTLPWLLADIGGTNARFALSDGVAPQDVLTLPCADFPTLASAAQHYLRMVDERRQLQQASLAIAAPITGDVIQMTNHHWRISVSELRAELGLQRLVVVNDFTALALAIRHLPAQELQQVGGVLGHDLDKPIALLGAGTGLGVSGLVPCGEQWQPLQGEGGHVSLAPGSVREVAVLQTLWRQFPHVSAERVLSGPGLENLYRVLCELDGVSAQPWSAAAITQQALQQREPRCVEVLELFCGWLGSVAGNLVLTLGATQAVFIGGGIVPRLGEFFVRSAFRARFEAKGRYADYLRPVPAFVIHSSQPALLGVQQALWSPGPRVEARA